MQQSITVTLARGFLMLSGQKVAKALPEARIDFR
jgi:hypothetical protein